MACDEVCGKKRWRRSKGDTWGWSEEVREAVSRKKDKHTRQCVRIVLRGIIGGMKE